MEMAENGVINLGYNTNTEKDTKEKPLSHEDVSVKVGGNHHPAHNAPEGELPKELDDQGYSYDPDTGDIILQKKSLKENTNSCALAVSRVQNGLSDLYRKYQKTIWKIIGVVILLLYLGYVIYSLAKRGVESEGQVRLLGITIFMLWLLMLHLGEKQLQPLYKAVGNFKTSPRYIRPRYWIKWALYLLSTVTTVTLIIVLVALENPKNLLSLAGLAALLLICYVTSYSPAMVLVVLFVRLLSWLFTATSDESQIEWHAVFWGFSLQFYFAVIILKTRWGYEIFSWLGDRVTEFLQHSDEGAKFTFGDLATISFQKGTTLKIRNATMSNGSSLALSLLQLVDDSTVVFTAVYTIHFLAFKVLPVVIFFSAFIGIITYLGVMSFVVKSVGSFLSFCLGTTPAESLNAAGNIFIGMSESPMLIRPYIGKMTSSELHAVMTGGFATIAGTVLGVYIGFGVPADHLLTASVMSAPAALAISKMTYPEVEVPILQEQDYGKVSDSGDSNLIQAACNGATLSGKICAAIIVNVIAFLSLLKFVNATLMWFGDRAGVDNLTFEYISSYVLYPIALFMGVDTEDCRRVAELIGIKTFTNEFIAFSKLSVLLKNRKEFDEYTLNPNNTWHQDGDDIYLHGLGNQLLDKGIMQPRSEVIATYALCGFANFGAIGILMGGLSALAPKRVPTMAKLIFRSMIAGNIACFFTACIAGLFYDDFE